MLHYPNTEEGNRDHFRDSITVICVHIFAALLFLIGIILLLKNLKWARRLNPALLTLSFVLEPPIYPIYGLDYLIVSMSVHMACTYMVPWLICETLIS